MFLQKTGLLLQSTITALLFCLFLTHFCRGQSQVIGPSQPIVATLGDDIILPCYLEPAYDATTVTVEWARPDLNPRFIYVSRSGQELEKLKNPSYKERTSLFIDELKHGNISLKISKVKRTDSGRYRCFVPELNEDTFMDLVVVSGAVSQPVTTLAGLDGKGGVELQCESAGWYPEPEVLWLDGDGNLLSAGPTETVRGPDDLYTVSSRVTVEKKHSNKFTCRVQQNNINQSRETWIHVPDDFFKVQSSNTSTIAGLAVSLVVSIILLILAVVLFVHTRRHNRTKRREDVQNESEKEDLMSMKTLENKKQPESKQGSKETEVSLLVDEERLQDQLEEEKLNPEEQQRRKEDEITIHRLKEKLDMKKTEVKNKQTELQSLQEEKKKIQDDLQNLIKDLNTKITESDARKEKNKKKEDEKRMQTEIENLNKQLMTKNMEFQNKDKKCEEKQVELKELLDDQQKMETELQIEEQQLGTNKMKKEYDDIMNQLHQEEEERKKAENEVKTLNSHLEKLMVTKKTLLDEKLKWTETEGKLKTVIQKMNKELDEGDSQRWQQRHENTTVGNQLEELEKKLKEKKKKWMETERELEKKLKEKKEQWTGTERKLEISRTNSASGTSTTPPITIEEVNERDRYIRLKNSSNKEIQLGGWKLVLQINNREPTTLTFGPFKFQAGRILCIRSPYSSYKHPHDADVDWSELENWWPKDKLQMNLISDNGETFRLL